MIETSTSSWAMIETSISEAVTTKSFYFLWFCHLLMHIFMQAKQYTEPFEYETYREQQTQKKLEEQFVSRITVRT
jgi:hypothetical protein